MKKIPIRLLTIINILKRTDTITDIGTDHGIIPYYIIKQKLSKKCIATDINKNIILNLKENLSKKLSNEELKKIDLRVGDGLNPIKYNESNVIIISGMGYDLIKKILCNINNYKFDFLIISPQTKIPEFRKFILNKKLKITKEFLIKENNKYYFIFKIKKTILNIKYKDYEYLYSKNLIKERNYLLIEYIEENIKEYKKIFDITNNKKFKEYIDISILTLNKMGVKYDI